ncbi:MAG: AAA family ATPase [Planctomycetaceae bacterium]
MSESERPVVVVVAGPNGAGKSTAAPPLVRDLFGVTQFVNADVIAQGLSAFDPNRAAIEAGRIMLQRLHDLGERREMFAFETTLASRSFAPWLRQLKAHGYQIAIVYFWLPTPEDAIARVQDRIAAGGHAVAESVVRRRYRRGLHNFFEVYSVIADGWQFWDNSSETGPAVIAAKSLSGTFSIHQPETWHQIQEQANGS